MKEVTLKVEGMSCQHCVSSIEGALKALGAKAKVDLTNRHVDVAYNETKMTIDAVKNAIEEQGYDVKE